MSIQAKEHKIILDWSSITDPEIEYDRLVSLGKQHYQGTSRYADYQQLPICEFNTKFHLSKTNDLVTVINFDATSESLVMNGMLSLLVSLYDQTTIQEIKLFKPSWLQRIKFSAYIQQKQLTNIELLTKWIKLFATQTA